MHSVAKIYLQETDINQIISCLLNTAHIVHYSSRQVKMEVDAFIH